MTCLQRKGMGTCNHYQCPHENICVDVIGGYCDIGEDCLPECEYSYPPIEREKAAE